MNVEQLLKQDFSNPELKKTVEADNSLKDLFVNYVGNKLNPKNGNVTVEMIIQVLAEEFPEFIMAVAEENFMRGYEQALEDKKHFGNKKKTKNKK